MAPQSGCSQQNSAIFLSFLDLTLYCHCRGCHRFWFVPHSQNKCAVFLKHLPEVRHCPAASLEACSGLLICILQCWSSFPRLLVVNKKHNIHDPLRQTSSVTRYTSTRNRSRHGDAELSGTPQVTAGAPYICRSSSL